MNLDINKFHECHKFFLQFDNINDLFELINDMKENEFNIKYECEELFLILKIEQRKKIIEIPIKLEKKK